MIATPDTDLPFWTRFVLERVPVERPSLLPHLAVVALQAPVIGQRLGLDAEEQAILRIAGLLHDVGKIPSLAATGFHPVDGARVAADAGASRVAELVAHHTGSRYEAEMHGVTIGWPWAPSASADALMLADLTTGPGGRVVALEGRRSDIEQRYAADSIEVRSLQRLWPEILDAQTRLAAR